MFFETQPKVLVIHYNTGRTCFYLDKMHERLILKYSIIPHDNSINLHNNRIDLHDKVKAEILDCSLESVINAEKHSDAIMCEYSITMRQAEALKKYMKGRDGKAAFDPKAWRKEYLNLVINHKEFTPLDWASKELEQVGIEINHNDFKNPGFVQRTLASLGLTAK